MQIDFERSGGFAGMSLATSLDTGSLPPEEAEELRQMIDAAKFFQLPATLTGEGPDADRFQYKLTIQTEGREHTIRAGEAAVPDELWPLLRRLTTLARSRPGS